MAGNVSYTLDNYLLPGVIRNSHLPAANVTFQAADVGAICDDEVSTSILKTILSTREGFYLRSVDLTADANGIVHIPYRAIGGRIHKVQFVSGNVILPAARIEPSDMTNAISPPTNAYAFYIEGNDIVTLPIATVPVRVWYYLTPNSLTPMANCGQVTAITPTTVTVSATPSTFATGFLIDFVQDQPPFGILSYDQALTNVSGSTLTFAAGVIPSNLAVGDWICPAGQTPVANIPKEFQPVLKQRATVRVLEFQGHMQRLQAAQGKLTESQQAVLDIINPRVEENPKKITPDRGLVSPGFSRRSNWVVGK
jgi:hypothetical protein